MRTPDRLTSKTRRPRRQSYGWGPRPSSSGRNALSPHIVRHKRGRGQANFRDISRSECRPWPGRAGVEPSRRRIGVNGVTPHDTGCSAEKHGEPRRGSRLDWARYQGELLTALHDHPLRSVKTRLCCRRYRSSILRPGSSQADRRVTRARHGHAETFRAYFRWAACLETPSIALISDQDRCAP